MGKAARVVPGASSQAAGATTEAQVVPVSLEPRVASGASSPGPSGRDVETPWRSRTSSEAFDVGELAAGRVPGHVEPAAERTARGAGGNGRPLDIDEESVRAVQKCTIADSPRDCLIGTLAIDTSASGVS